MKLMVFILNRNDVLDKLLEGFSAAGIRGATIIESAGLAVTLSRMGSNIFSASLKALLSAEENNHTIISVIKDSQLEIARKVIYRTVGDLSKPNTGVLCTMPLDFVEGTIKKTSDTVEEKKEK
ncbi:MAG: hypothetical protein IJC65_01295 [Oscillospiraceae bacterium]|nr:hypothetical protein [Oscillospiraceae bacterium]